MKKFKIIALIKLTGLIYTIAFIITTFVFIFFTPQLIGYINALSQKLFPSLPLALQQGQFYIILSLSMMAGVTVCSFLLYRNVEDNINMIIPLVIMKFTSSLCGLLAFLSGFVYANGANNLANCVIFITDFPLGLWVMYLYRLLQRCNE
ncbi:MAG: hypothetical protein N3F66_10510 [Spirochaetes bacterium]|nr:hypothetical protein [Spirochaetota bacterium]